MRRQRQITQSANGLLFDENGVRLKPSHAGKSGRRYRYYITDPESGSLSEDSETRRLPAREIEKVVIDGVIGFFGNKARLPDVMGVDDGQVGKVLSGASKLVTRLRGVDTSEQRKMLLVLMDRTVVYTSHIRVYLHAIRVHEYFGTNPVALRWSDP